MFESVTEETQVSSNPSLTNTGVFEFITEETGVLEFITEGTQVSQTPRKSYQTYFSVTITEVYTLCVFLCNF